VASDTYHDSDSGGVTAAFETAATGSDFASFRVLTELDRKAIVAIIESKMRITLAQAQVREDVKEVADRLGMKSSELNRIMRLAIRERESGNVLAHEKALIEVAEQVAG
jgi:Fe-S cluster assembly scaffold protein SufB